LVYHINVIVDYDGGDGDDDNDDEGNQIVMP